MINSNEVIVYNETQHEIDRFVDEKFKQKPTSGSTVESILKNVQVKKHGFFGRLTSNQENLITTVVSLLQDHLHSDAKKNAESLKQLMLAEREALKAVSNSFAATAKNLYSMPLIRSRTTTYEHPVETPAQNKATPPKTTFLMRFLSWGNFIAMAAILLAILVMKTSIETANFKTQYLNAAAAHESLGEKHDALLLEFKQINSEKQAISQDFAVSNAKFAEYKQHTKIQISEQANLIQQQQLKLSNLEGINRSTLSTNGQEVSALEQEVALLKAKDSQNIKNEQLWKTLAEDKMQEINQLRQQLSTASKQSTQQGEKEYNFWKLFD